MLIQPKKLRERVVKYINDNFDRFKSYIEWRLKSKEGSDGEDQNEEKSDTDY